MGSPWAWPLLIFQLKRKLCFILGRCQGVTPHRPVPWLAPPAGWHTVSSERTDSASLLVSSLCPRRTHHISWLVSLHLWPGQSQGFPAVVAVAPGRWQACHGRSSARSVCSCPRTLGARVGRQRGGGTCPCPGAARWVLLQVPCRGHARLVGATGRLHGTAALCPLSKPPLGREVPR